MAIPTEISKDDRWLVIEEHAERFVLALVEEGVISSERVIRVTFAIMAALRLALAFKRA